ncbi:hypothetical protein R1sor_014356 [Riccia sorocarpa]|uniref:Uncharacterized protein n=1 Tax=Riccia sorocarpa TaxID=122646 RepID=A0ABD3HC67_9MARC
MYVHHGRLSTSQGQEALAEFQRRIETGESDVVVVVGTGVPLLDMLDELEYLNCGAIFEARFDDVGVVDESTVAEIVIIKFREQSHQTIVSEIVGQLGDYRRATNNKLRVGGGAVQLTGRVRIPDCGISPWDRLPGENPQIYRLIVEVEKQCHRSNDDSRTFAAFAALAVLYRRRVNNQRRGANAALAVLYRRRVNNQRRGANVTIVDAVKQ